MTMACDTPIYRGKKRGQPASGTTAGYNRHRRAGEPSCAPCLEAASANAKAWHRANPEGQRASEAKWRKANPDKIRAKYLRIYNLTLEDFEDILKRQDGRCAICGTDQPGGRGLFEIDHDHSCCDFKGSCGWCIRGILCHSCNTRLATIEDRDFVKLAKSYLKLHS